MKGCGEENRQSCKLKYYYINFEHCIFHRKLTSGTSLLLMEHEWVERPSRRNPQDLKEPIPIVLHS